MQLPLFDDRSQQRPPSPDGQMPRRDRYEGALLYSTIGDALGWPTESLDPAGKRQPPFSVPLRTFVTWKKRVGGKWWGYEDHIAAGSYSDDTQLTLAVARCIDDQGRFEPERFAYEELPLWLQYERGGGRTVKTAARKLVSKRANWLGNFYKQGDLEYREAGANGAAMRNLPIALANVHNKQALIRDSCYNAIITHGHPRAILGTVLFGLAIHCALTLSAPPPAQSFIECLLDGLRQVQQVMRDDERLRLWIHIWNRGLLTSEHTFEHVYRQTLKETVTYLKDIPRRLQEEPGAYYASVGALDRATRGSGIGTVCVAIYLFVKYLQQPEQAITIAVNTFGSDTDTIALFLGGLLGAFHGVQSIPTHLLGAVQDRELVTMTAQRLHALASGQHSALMATAQEDEVRVSSYFDILSWEIAFHDMFHNEHQEGDSVIHPALGLGTIVKQEEQSLQRQDYVARLIHVQFNCGQTCVFHSRVKANESPSESLAQAVARALE
jgi:ADP-ribosylglycohydrolase